jgi:hypothetical protein
MIYVMHYDFVGKPPPDGPVECVARGIFLENRTEAEGFVIGFDTDLKIGIVQCVEFRVKLDPEDVWVFLMLDGFDDATVERGGGDTDALSQLVYCLVMRADDIGGVGFFKTHFSDEFSVFF